MHSFGVKQVSIFMNVDNTLIFLSYSVELQLATFKPNSPGGEEQNSPNPLTNSCNFLIMSCVGIINSSSTILIAFESRELGKTYIYFSENTFLIDKVFINFEQLFWDMMASSKRSRDLSHCFGIFWKILSSILFKLVQDVWQVALSSFFFLKKDIFGRNLFSTVFKLTLFLVLLSNTMQGLYKICCGYEKGYDKKSKSGFIISKR